MNHGTYCSIVLAGALSRRPFQEQVCHAPMAPSRSRQCYLSAGHCLDKFDGELPSEQGSLESSARRQDGPACQGRSPRRASTPRSVPADPTDRSETENPFSCCAEMPILEGMRWHSKKWPALESFIAALAILLPTLGSVSVASAANQRSRIVSAGGGLWTYDSAGGDKKQILDGVVGQGPYSPRWSNDGSWIAYMYGFQIWVVRADGSGARKLAGTRSNIPEWSADDRRIYYTAFIGGADTRIGWVSLDGTDGGIVPTGETNVHSARWSPNGRTMAVSVESNGSFSVETMDGSGSNRKVIAFERGTSYSPAAWSPDGRKILVTALVGGARFDVVVMNSDGTGRTTIRQNAIADAWSPDGSRILFHDAHSQRSATMRPDGTGVMDLPGPGGDTDWGPGTVDQDPVPNGSQPTTVSTIRPSVPSQPPLSGRVPTSMASPPPGSETAPSTTRRSDPPASIISPPAGIPGTAGPPVEVVGKEAAEVELSARATGLGAKGFVGRMANSRRWAMTTSLSLLTLVAACLGIHAARSRPRMGGQ